jgi:predicted Zn finger-like uncharacterized protein
MNIACPHCSFSREVPDGQIPARPVRVTCPKCRQGFDFDKGTAGDAVTTCPACGLTQPAGDLCAGCGVVYAKWAARQEAPRQDEASSTAAAGDAAFPCRDLYAAQPLPHELPKAGFWIRCVAYLLDSMILVVAQFAISLALGFAGGALLGDGGLALPLISALSGMVISLTYAVFFTGYNGQTPGKMALRIQVIRTDGSAMTYGRAFLREVVGKFASGIILGIGYLMAGFDRQKQGLHDKIAGTYVIKL